MSIITDMDLSNVQEPKTAPPGEYKLRINSATIQESNDSKRLSIGMSIEGTDDPAVKDLFHTLWFPKATDTPKQQNDTKYNWVRFKQAFDIPLEENDTANWVGKEGWAVLGEKDNGEYGMQNNIKKLIASH